MLKARMKAVSADGNTVGFWGRGEGEGGRRGEDGEAVGSMIMIITLIVLYQSVCINPSVLIIISPWGTGAEIRKNTEYHL